MPEREQTTIVPAVFDDSILVIDLERLPPAAATALSALRRRVQRTGGIHRDYLKRCHAGARDGTDLAGCVKTYVPWPDGPWGIVFRAGEDPRRPFALYTIAYGHRHPGARRTSVYQIAHQRLHCKGGAARHRPRRSRSSSTHERPAG